MTIWTTGFTFFCSTCFGKTFFGFRKLSHTFGSVLRFYQFFFQSNLKILTVNFWANALVYMYTCWCFHINFWEIHFGKQIVCISTFRRWYVSDHINWFIWWVHGHVLMEMSKINRKIKKNQEKYSLTSCGTLFSLNEKN